MACEKFQASDDITISGVLTGYPAHKAGLLDNDKILKVYCSSLYISLPIMVV